MTQTWFNDTDNRPEGKKAIHSLFIDFSEAFDLVDHAILLSKLKDRSISKSLWLCTKSFLQEITQQVNLAGVLSSLQICQAGVAQGSALSPPLLFSIFIDDFGNFIPVEMERVRMCKYADDCTVYESVPNGCSSNNYAESP